MDESLRESCRRFLERKRPPGLSYVPDSIAERVLMLYAAGEPPDGELAELLEIAIADSRTTAEELGGDAGSYLSESADLLERIAGETAG